ncbi:MAG TPA: hypothetical protein VMW54_11880 [Terriglobia bacterium]|nr:hypothetical protein [Terriglobia bacterium]
MKKLVQRIVGEEPGLAGVAWAFYYRNDDLFKLEVLASVLNDVPPDSPEHWLAELIERLVTTPPAKQEWVKLAAPIIGPTPCTPAPGSPLYVLNKFLETNPCILRIEGLGRANGIIAVNATHIPFSVVAGMSRDVDRILWLLWEVLYRAVDLTRLKTCPICHKWFVDHTKNKSKARCSARCTWQWWSWEARKKARHKRLPKKGVERLHRAASCSLSDTCRTRER